MATREVDYSVADPGTQNFASNSRLPSEFPKPPQCATAPTRGWHCSNMPITKNAWSYAASMESGLERQVSEPMELLEASSPIYKDYLRYTQCLDNI